MGGTDSKYPTEFFVYTHMHIRMWVGVYYTPHTCARTYRHTLERGQSVNWLLSHVPKIWWLRHRMSVSFLFQTKTVFFTRQRTYRLLSPLVILTFIPYLCQEKPASHCSALCILGIYVHSGASFSSRLPDDRRMSGSRAVTRCQFFKEGFLYGFGGFQKMPSSQKKQIFYANR